MVFYNNQTVKVCKDSGSEIGRTWVPVLLGWYMLITNVLLLNLLIAKFNFIFQNVQIKSEEVWAWQKYRLMKEYDVRSKCPVPFSLFWWLLNGIFKMCRHRHVVEDKDSYTITAKVGDQYGAGKTDGKRVTLHSELGNTLRETFKLKDKTQDVEKKKPSKPLDNLTKISFEQEEGAQPWYLASVQIKHNASGTEYHVIHNDWIFEESHSLKLRKGSCKNEKSVHAVASRYEIKISGIPDENISKASLKLVGKRGESETKDIQLDRGVQTPCFQIKSTNIGFLLKVEINQETGITSWIDYIEIKNEERRYRFPNKKTSTGSIVSILPEIIYTVKVTTGEATKGDLSRERVNLQLIGENNETTGLLILDTNPNPSSQNKLKFQKGETDHFLIKINHTWKPKYVRLVVDELIKDKDKAWFLESLTLESPTFGDPLVFEHGDIIYGDTTLARKEYDYDITVTGYQKGKSLTWSLLLDGGFWTIGPIPMELEKGKLEKKVKAPKIKNMKLKITAKSNPNDEFHLDVSVKCESNTKTWEFKNSGDLYKHQDKFVELSPVRILPKDVDGRSEMSDSDSDASASDTSDDSSDDDSDSSGPSEDERTKQRKRGENQRKRQRQSLIDFERGHGKWAILQLKEKEKELNLN